MTNTTVAPNTAPVVQDVTPSGVLAIQAVWTEFVARYHQANKIIQDLQVMEDELRHCERHERIVHWKPDNGSVFLGTADNAVLFVVEIAIRELSPHGCPLDISVQDVQRSWKDPQGALRDEFSPIAVWRQLLQRFGRGQAAQVAYSQAASAIVSHFDLTPGAAPKIAAGFIELQMRTWSTACYVKPKALRHDMDTASEVYQALQGLGGFLSWAQPESRGSYNVGMQRLLRQTSDQFTGFSSRERFALGALEAILFKDKTVIRMPMAFADQLNEFVSTYAPQFQPAKAA